MSTHTLNKLSARAVATATKPGRYSDGGGLYLVVGPDGRGKWVLRFTLRGKARDMGLGTVATVGLSEARSAARNAREHVRAGRDPIAERDRERDDAARVPTFGEMADSVVESLESGFRNEKHRAQWRMTLTEYAAPLRPMPVDTIRTEDVLAVLKPIWQTKNETASRLRGRIERVLDAARAKGHRTGENPARWRGHLDKLLPKRQKLARGHHAAMPFDDVPAFMTRLRTLDSISARALEFTVLTAARSGEVLGMRWPEVDFEAKLWTVPANRMKAGRVHRVPLTDRALAILEEMQQLRTGDNEHVFPGARAGKPLSVMAMTMVLRRLKVDVTVHGFRSAFRDWAGERTSFPREVAEQALAHVVGNATERAYRHGDALDKRRKLMTAWTGWCEPKAGKVIPLRR
jgi:integrase